MFWYYKKILTVTLNDKYELNTGIFNHFIITWRHFFVQLTEYWAAIFNGQKELLFATYELPIKLRHIWQGLDYTKWPHLSRAWWLPWATASATWASSWDGKDHCPEESWMCFTSHLFIYLTCVLHKAQKYFFTCIHNNYIINHDKMSHLLFSEESVCVAHLKKKNKSNVTRLQMPFGLESHHPDKSSKKHLSTRNRNFLSFCTILTDSWSFYGQLKSSFGKIFLLTET